jgi:hypothetical protein
VFPPVPVPVPESELRESGTGTLRINVGTGTEPFEKLRFHSRVPLLCVLQLYFCNYKKTILSPKKTLCV